MSLDRAPSIVVRTLFPCRDDEHYCGSQIGTEDGSPSNERQSQTEELASVDPETGAKQPEVHRMVTFAAAHHVEALRHLRGPSTQDQPLAELMR